MQRHLKLSLAMTLLLTVAALWPGSEAGPVAAIADGHASVGTMGTGPLRADQGRASRSEDASSHLRWRSNLLEPASRDFFASGIPVAQAAPVAVAPPVSPPSEPVVIPTPLPQYRFLGRMVTPDGQQMVYLGGQGDQAASVKAGDRLDDGWVVDHLDQEGIHLLYPPTQQRMVVAIASSDQ